MKNKLQENTSGKTRKVARIPLALKREVIRELSARDLTEVIGGVDDTGVAVEGAGCTVTHGA